MIADPASVSALLLRAAAIVRRGWCRGRSAENDAGAALIAVAPNPPPMRASAAEIALSPTRFDVGTAMFRAIAKQNVPRGKTKEEARLLYFSVAAADRVILTAAERAFCLAAKTLHPSLWNDRDCRSGEEAAGMLEAAARAR